MAQAYDGRNGVLPSQHLRRAIADGVVSADDEVPAGNVQPASLDLRLGDVAHRVRCSFLARAGTVEERLRELRMHELDLRDDGAVLEVGVPYVVPLQERLRLPAEMRARANPKSSTGRADVFTRVITDRGARFDDVAAGYSGPLYLEVVPLSFPIRVRRGLTLNQLRLSIGDTALTDRDIRAEHAERPLLSIGRKPLAARDLQTASGLFVGLNLVGSGDRGVGWRARGSAPILDLTQVRATDPEPFWDKVTHDKANRIVLQPNSFYLLMSLERITIPPHLAAEMAAYDPTSGELRTHYAGFFDPGFGYDASERVGGSTAALEVRAHDLPFLIEHGQHVCKLTFERMLEPPEVLYGDSGFGSNYQGQTETRGKHFRLDQVPSTPGGAPEPPMDEEPLLDLGRG